MATTPEIRRLSWEESLAWWRANHDHPHLKWGTEPDRHRLIAWHPESGEKLMAFRPPMPWLVLPDEREKLPAYTAALAEEPEPYLMFLLQAGSVALGYFEEGEVTVHKAFKKYTKRESQGKAQIYYLKKRGKSKAGSRVRLANQTALFEDTTERLTEWMEAWPVNRIIYSCNPTLWGMLYQTKPPMPFDRHDSRLVKAPFDVDSPDFEELLRINRLIKTGELTTYTSSPVR